MAKASGITFDATWEALKRKRPDFGRSDVVIEFTPENLRRLLKQVYEQGVASVKVFDLESPFDDFL